MNSRARATSSSSKGAAANNKSPGLASNGRPFRIRLVKCGIDHKEIPVVLRKNMASRPSPARGSSLDLAKPSLASNNTALNINQAKREGGLQAPIPKTRNGSVQPPTD